LAVVVVIVWVVPWLQGHREARQNAEMRAAIAGVSQVAVERLKLSLSLDSSTTIIIDTMWSQSVKVMIVADSRGRLAIATHQRTGAMCRAGVGIDSLTGVIPGQSVCEKEDP